TAEANGITGLEAHRRREAIIRVQYGYYGTRGAGAAVTCLTRGRTYIGLVAKLSKRVAVLGAYVLQIDLVERIGVQRMRERKSQHSMVDVTEGEGPVRVHEVRSLVGEIHNRLHRISGAPIHALPGIVRKIPFPQRHSRIVIVRHDAALRREHAVCRQFHSGAKVGSDLALERVGVIGIAGLWERISGLGSSIREKESQVAQLLAKPGN